MLGHSAETIAELATAGSEAWLWLHDFVTLCPSPHLQRNGIAFCGGPTLRVPTPVPCPPIARSEPRHRRA